MLFSNISRYAENLVASNHVNSDIRTNLSILHKGNKDKHLDSLKDIEIYKEKNSNR